MTHANVQMVSLALLQGNVRMMIAPSQGSLRTTPLAQLQGTVPLTSMTLLVPSPGSVQITLLAVPSQGSARLSQDSARTTILLAVPSQGSRVRMLARIPLASVVASLRGGCSSPSARRPSNQHSAMCCAARGSRIAWRMPNASTDSSPTRRQGGGGTQPSALTTCARATWCLLPRRSKGARSLQPVLVSLHRALRRSPLFSLQHKLCPVTSLGAPALQHCMPHLDLQRCNQRLTALAKYARSLVVVDAGTPTSGRGGCCSSATR
jgi:hypothetical protein